MNLQLRAFIPMLILALHMIPASAQHEYDVWYFGANAGINFTTGTPVVLTNGQVNTVEGTACISDTAGNLLFYTDGVTVRNKNHQQMINGNNLNGGGSSTQSALIVQQPGSDSLYFIFTVAESGGSNGLNYSIVDMTLQGGLGEVILKNVPLVPSTTEKVCAARHSNGTDIWIITHKMSNADFYAYQLSATGVNSTAVVSTSGSNHFDAIGYLKASHDGSKLALAVHNYFFELFDFDNTTGVVSNPINLPSPPTAFGPYGVEFSPNDSILYGTAYSGPCVLLQWDISSGNGTMINASRLAIDTSAASNIGALQLASDGKIYMAEYSTTYLGVINDPDVYGTGCNFVDVGFSVAPKMSQMGLPNIPDFWLETQYFPGAAFLSTDTSLCQKFCIDFSDLSTNSPTSWEWLFPGAIPASSSDQNPTNICYDNPGVFDVTLISTNSFGTDTVTLPGFITVYATPPFPVISQNGSILTSSPAATYQWQFNSIDVPGATSQTFSVTQTGYYTVNISDSNGCISSSTTYIEITGIDDLCAESDLFISPNPSSGNFRIEWVDCFPSAPVKLEVRNTLGQVVFHYEGNDGQPFSKMMDLHDLPAAVYFLDVTFDEKRFQKKLIITK